VDQRLRWAVVTLLVAIVAIAPTPRAYASTLVKYSLQGLEPVTLYRPDVRRLGVNDAYVYFSYMRPSGPTGIARLDASRGSTTLYDLPGPPESLVVGFDFDEKYVWALTSNQSGTKYLRGVNLTDGGVISWQVAVFPESGVTTNGICVENDHSIWLTGGPNGFLKHFNSLSGEMKTYPLPTNFTTLFRPIWSEGKVWAIAMRETPLPMYAGDALMMFDPYSETMTFYDLPSYGYRPSEPFHMADFVYDMAIDYRGNLWLFSEKKLAKFDTASKELTAIESPYKYGAPGTCDKEGNVFFVHEGLVGFSSSSQTFTEYPVHWETTDPFPQVRDIAVDADNNVWFTRIFYSGQTGTMELYRLFRGGVGTTVTLTTTFTSEHASLSAIPSTKLIQTSDTATTTQSTKISAAVMRSESTLTAASTTILTETRLVDEFSGSAILVLLVSILVPMFARRKTPSGTTKS